MSDDLKFEVFPDEPELKDTPETLPFALTEEEKKDIRGVGFIEGLLLWSIFCAASTIIGFGIAQSSKFSSGSYVYAVIAAVLIPSIFVLWFHYTKKRNNREERDENIEKRRTKIMIENRMANEQISSWNINEKMRVKSKAEELTSKLSNVFTSSLELKDELRHNLNQTSLLLEKAETEYNDNAFSPFWDAIETAAKRLALFNERAIKQSQNADEYYKTLNGRKHSFPSFPSEPQAIVDASGEVEKFQRIVRMGQTNFQFANIWEHRRTREAVIAGFRTLGEAVNNLGDRVEYSLSNLQQSISSDLAQVVEEQIRTRASIVEEQIKTRETLDERMLEQNRMLDNIQKHREPDILDTPKKY